MRWTICESYWRQRCHDWKTYGVGVSLKSRLVWLSKIDPVAALWFRSPERRASQFIAPRALTASATVPRTVLKAATGC